MPTTATDGKTNLWFPIPSIDCTIMKWHKNTNCCNGVITGFILMLDKPKTAHKNSWIMIEVDSDDDETYYYKINTGYPCRRDYGDYF